jgi:hypothetical protein
MVWVPGCENHNIPPGPNDPRIVPRILVLHVEEGTNVGSERRFRATGLEAHFGVPKVGKTWQWRDTDFQADAQAAGNGYCISFETEGFATEPLNNNQIDEMIRVGGYLQDHYNIPAVMVKKTTDKGWGYHRQFPSWNPNNHSCPGDIRLRQLQTVLLPALAEESVGDDMTAEQARQLEAVYKGLIAQGTTSPNATVDILMARVRNNEKYIGLLCEQAGIEFSPVDTSQFS